MELRNWIFLIILVCWTFSVRSWRLEENLSPPTQNEIDRAVTHGANSWGQLLRKTGNLKLLCLGGSQTAMTDTGGTGLTQLLEFFVKQISPESYVINGGRGSTPPQAFVGSSYEWEEWDESRWPNVIMLDFSLNTLPSDSWKSAEAMEQIIRSINLKYHNKGVPRADIMFLELTLLRGLWPRYNKRVNNNNTAGRFSTLNNLSTVVTDTFFAGNGFNRGCANCGYIRELAAFHGYPVVSYRNAVFPSFLRAYLSTNETIRKSIYHIVSGDGIHQSIWGRMFLQNYLLKPFFLNAMKPRETAEEAQQQRASVYSHYYHEDLQMFAPRELDLDVERWTCWGHEGNRLKLVIAHNDASVDPAALHNKLSNDNTSSDNGSGSDGGEELHNKWLFQSTPGHAHNRGHVCYGSNVTNSVSVFSIHPPKECTVAAPCALRMSSIYSWNQHHFGKMTCETILITTEKKITVTYVVAQKNVTAIDSIRHDNRIIRGTIPLEIMLLESVVRHDEGTKVQVKCKVLDRKHSCITSFRLTHKGLI